MLQETKLCVLVGNVVLSVGRKVGELLDVPADFDEATHVWFVCIDHASERVLRAIRHAAWCVDVPIRTHEVIEPRTIQFGAVAQVVEQDAHGVGFKGLSFCYGFFYRVFYHILGKLRIPLPGCMKCTEGA
jgi:hypothetical protein